MSNEYSKKSECTRYARRHPLRATNLPGPRGSICANLSKMDTDSHRFRTSKGPRRDGELLSRTPSHPYQTSRRHVRSRQRIAVALKCLFVRRVRVAARHTIAVRLAPGARAQMR